MWLGGDLENCAQENKACFVQSCFWNNNQPFKISGSAAHSAVLAVDHTLLSAPFTAVSLRNCMQAATLPRTELQWKHEAMKSRQFEDNKLTFWFLPRKSNLQNLWRCLPTCQIGFISRHEMCKSLENYDNHLGWSFQKPHFRHKPAVTEISQNWKLFMHENRIIFLYMIKVLLGLH